MLLIESAQASAGYRSARLLERMPILAAVKEAKVRGSVFPGDLITIEASLVHEGSGFAVTRQRSASAASFRANSALTFTLIPFPNSDMRGYMNSVAERVGFPREAISP